MRQGAETLRTQAETYKHLMIQVMTKKGKRTEKMSKNGCKICYFVVSGTTILFTNYYDCTK